MGRCPKGTGVGAPTATHCSQSPSLQPSLTIQSVVAQAATIRKVVMKQHVKAMT